MTTPSSDYITYICSLYGSLYDDRIENTAPPTAGGEGRTPGEDWMPGMTAEHKSLAAFQRELEEQGIKLSTSKIKKILITGNLWTTETSRTIQELFSTYTSSVDAGGEGMTEAAAVKRIAEELDVSAVTVSVNLPYMDVVYNLPELSANAKRCRRWKERKRAFLSPTVGNMDESDPSLWLWKKIIAYEGQTFTTSGRGSRPGVSFSYSISRTEGRRGGGSMYAGTSVEGYGNELWITTADGVKKKSISRSTVDLAYEHVVEMKGCVPGPRSLHIPGAGSYVYGIFKRLGVISSEHPGVTAPKSHGSHIQMKMLATDTKQAFAYKDGEQVFYFANAGAQLARAASLQGASCSNSSSVMSA